jgi:hypothetical protein
MWRHANNKSPTELLPADCKRFAGTNKHVLIYQEAARNTQGVWVQLATHKSVHATSNIHVLG